MANNEQNTPLLKVNKHIYISILAIPNYMVDCILFVFIPPRPRYLRPCQNKHIFDLLTHQLRTTAKINVVMGHFELL